MPARSSAPTRGIDYKHEDFVKVVKDATAGRGVDVILDMVGGDYVQRNISALAVEGRIVNIAFLQRRAGRGQFHAADAEAPDHHRLDPARRAPVEQKGAIAAALRREVWPLLDAGQGQAGDLQDLPAEPRRPRRIACMESSAHIGKIVLTI